MSRLLAVGGLVLAGFALSDPVPCHGNACPAEDDQAAMLQSSLLHKGETSDSMVAEESGRRRRRRRRGPKSWGREIERTYCSNSYDGQNSRRAAKRACKKDDACGGIYQPENDPGKWFLCKGFNTYSCNSNSVVIEKLSSSSPSPSPSPPSYDDNRRRSSPSSSSTCWGSKVSGYCSGSYGGGVSRSEAESQCMDSADCGGIYEPGAEPGNWYLCKDFNIFTSTSGSQSIRKECDATPSPSPSYDDDDDRDDDDDDDYNDDRRRRGRYPSPTPSPSPWRDDDRRRPGRYPSPSPSASCWGSEQAGYCSGSHGGPLSQSDAESACMDDGQCGGIYQPGAEPGQWYLCKDFDVYASSSGSRSIKKECDTTPSPSPSYDDDRRRRGGYPSPTPSPSPWRDDDRRRRGRYPSPSPSASCWGSEQAGYCSGSHGGPLSQSDAESACMDDTQCGGIYQPGAEPGQWYLCKDFNVYASSSGSKSIKKECNSLL